MRALAGIVGSVVTLLLASSGAAHAQSLAGACFTLAPLEPEWHPTPEFVDSIAPPPPSSDKFFLGVPGIFQLVRHPTEPPIRSDSSYIARLEPPDHPYMRGFADWSHVAGTLRLQWWDDYGSHRVMLAPSSPESDDWVGVFTLRTDMRVVPNPGDWKYKAEIRRIPCPPRGDGVS
jgi:hypothetical protein